MATALEFNRHFPFIILTLQWTLHDVDVSRLEADMAVQFSMPDNPDLIVVKLGRLHLHPFASRAYLDLYGVPKGREKLVEHRIVQQLAPGFDRNNLAEFFGLDNIENLVAIRTNATTAQFFAIEQGAGIGVLPTFAAALGAQIVPLDIGGRYNLDILLTYHANARQIARLALAIDWLKTIFDPKTHPWFRDDFIHPNDLVLPILARAKMNPGAGDDAA